MDRRHILFAVIIAAVLAVLSLVLPEPASSYYSKIMLPLTLLVGFILALQVASNYAKDLKKSFIFLSLFLVIYMFVNIEPVWNFIIFYGEKYSFIVPALQFINYAMLIASCIFTVRVIEARRMNRYGWVVFGLVCILCVNILYEFLLKSELNLVGIISINPLAAISLIMIRLFDNAIILMLVPVLILYMQHTRAKAQDSLTFALIMCGVIISLLSYYVITTLFGDNAFHIVEAVWLFGYLVIAIGLYAHRKYDEWGYKMIEKMLG